MAKPIRALELHYPMIQFLINPTSVRHFLNICHRVSISLHAECIKVGRRYTITNRLKNNYANFQLSRCLHSLFLGADGTLD